MQGPFFDWIQNEIALLEPGEGAEASVTMFGDRYNLFARREPTAGVLSRLLGSDVTLEVRRADSGVIIERTLASPRDEDAVYWQLHQSIVDAQNELNPNDAPRRFARKWRHTGPDTPSAQETVTVFGEPFELVSGGSEKSVIRDWLPGKLLGRKVFASPDSEIALITDGERVARYATGDLSQVTYLGPLGRTRFFQDSEEIHDQLVEDLREFAARSAHRHLLKEWIETA